MVSIIDDLTKQYCDAKEQEKIYKPVIKETGDQIKELLINEAPCKHAFGKYSISLSVTDKTTFDEEKLINLLKAQGHTELIKTKEYVDMEELENSVYHGEIEAQSLQAAQIPKVQHTLRYKVKEE